MCGRYSIALVLALLAERFGLYDIEEAILTNLVPRYNMAPTQLAPIITSDGGTRKLEPLQWRLILLHWLRTLICLDMAVARLPMAVI